jgi:hypothetical protein
VAETFDLKTGMRQKAATPTKPPTPCRGSIPPVIDRLQRNGHLVADRICSSSNLGCCQRRQVRFSPACGVSGREPSSRPGLPSSVIQTDPSSATATSRIAHPCPNARPRRAAPSLSKLARTCEYTAKPPINAEPGQAGNGRAIVIVAVRDNGTHTSRHFQ